MADGSKPVGEVDKQVGVVDKQVELVDKQVVAGKGREEASGSSRAEVEGVGRVVGVRMEPALVVWGHTQTGGSPGEVAAADRTEQLVGMGWVLEGSFQQDSSVCSLVRPSAMP